MHPVPFLSSVLAAGLALAFTPSLTLGQTGGFPTISARQFTGGSAKVTVTGSAGIDQEIPINTQASYGDGEVTWLQFGVSGSAEPNLLITYGETKEIGVSVGKGKFIATGGLIPGQKSECSGTVKVADTSITGEYTCVGVVSHDPATGMGKVNIKVSFTAKS